MKISKIFQLGSALLLSLSTLLTVSIPLAHAAIQNCTWTDASGTDNNFSTLANWSGCTDSPGTTPGDTYNLIFPSSTSNHSPVDDVSGLTVGSIAFTGTGGGYAISGSGGVNTITITGGITDTSGGPSSEIDMNITVSGNQTFSAGASSELFLGDGSNHVTLGSSNLTLGNVVVTGPVIGSGNIIIDDANYPADISGVDLQAPSNSFTGSVAVNQGALFVDDAGSLSSASSITVASGAFLKGNGGGSNVTVQSGGTIAPGHSPGCITATSMTINGTYLAQIGGTVACTGFDQLQVSNAVDVTNGTLQTTFVNGFTPTAGQSFTIIDNSGSNPVTGTFAGLAEGATFTSGGITFQISYVGGDGNDVTLTVVSSPVSASGSGSSAAPKSPNTGLAAAMGKPFTVLAVSTAAALSLLLIARRLKPLKT